jgi:hypothetical protein
VGALESHARNLVATAGLSEFPGSTKATELELDSSTVAATQSLEVGGPVHTVTLALARPCRSKRRTIKQQTCERDSGECVSNRLEGMTQVSAPVRERVREDQMERSHDLVKRGMMQVFGLP